MAIGTNANASGPGASSLGYFTTASGERATALGNLSVAIGYGSVAIGTSNTAAGSYATALGSGTKASGSVSTAMGFSTTAKSHFSTALGFQTMADGVFSTAMGSNVSTNGRDGSFIIGDSWEGLYANSDYDQMMMRFRGGYILYSSTPESQTAAIGVQLLPNGNAWQTLSDSTRKENFRPINGASFLQKIAKMRLGSWNYKGQDVKQYRHYGPIAQEFFAAFGQDELGTIGEDKSINQADFDGVNLIAIQSLIQKVEKLEAELSASKERESTTQARLTKVEALLNSSSTQTTVTFRP